MCVGGGGGGNTPVQPQQRAQDTQGGLEATALAVQEKDEPKSYRKDTRGARGGLEANKEKLKPKLQQKTPGGNDGPSPFNPRSISDASRYIGGQDIGF